MDASIFVIGALLILTGMDMSFNFGTQRGTVFPWTEPIHDFMVKIFDEHIF